MLRTPIKAVAFDWGNTLMRVFPEFEGPMVNWPKVEVIAGAAETLENLRPHYRLVLATNAMDSGPGEVERALARVGIDGFFELIYTAKHSGHRKDSPEFYRALLELLGLHASELLMVGDSYHPDVEVPAEAGCRTIWFNPEHKPCPSNPPRHAAVISHLGALPAMLQAIAF